MSDRALLHIRTVFLGAVLFVPLGLLALGVIGPAYVIPAMALAVYVILLVINFEAGFLTLIFIRSSLDMARGSDPQGGFNFAALASVLFIVLGVFYVMYRKVNILRYEETAPFMVFLVLCGLSLFGSVDRVHGAADWLRLVSVFFVYIIARGMANDRRLARVMLIVVLLSALVPIVMAYHQFLTGDRGERLQGTFNHPNPFGTYLMMLLVFSMAQILERESFVPKVFLVPLVLLTSFIFIMTKSLGAWIVFCVAMTVMGLLRYRKIFLAVPFVLAGVLFMPAVQERLQDLVDPSYARGHTSWEWRLHAWTDILPLVSEKPFFGHGLSTIEVTLGYLAHNDYLRLMAEVGIMGLLAYLWLAVCLLRKSWKDLRAARSPLVKSFQVGFLAVLLGILVREFADNTLRNTVTIIYFWIFAALARNLADLEQKEAVQ